MRFYFPDSQDQIDPSFDFETEERSPFRIRQRDDRYAHEVLSPGALHGHARLQGDGRRRRRRRRPLQRPAAPAPLPRRRPRVLPPRRGAGRRIDDAWATAARSPTSARTTPPYTVDEVIDFYEELRLRRRHLARPRHPRLRTRTDAERDCCQPEWERSPRAHARTRRGVPAPASRARLLVSSRSASRRAGARSPTPSPSQRSGHRLQADRARRPGRSEDPRDPRASSTRSRESATSRPRLHLLGVTRCEQIPEFASYGVTSFDSTSPFRQAFKDDRDNYYDVDANLGRAARAAGRGQREAPATDPRRRDRQASRRVDSSARASNAWPPSTAARRRRRQSDAALREYELLHDESDDRSRRTARSSTRCPMEALRLRGLSRRRHPGDHLPRHRAQQAPRLPQPARLRSAARRANAPEDS